jgi:hypothetical protein
LYCLCVCKFWVNVRARVCVCFFGGIFEKKKM